MLELVLLLALCPLAAFATRIELSHRAPLAGRALAPWAEHELLLSSVRAKYASVLPPAERGKRAKGDVELSNLFADATYTGDVSIGTPSQSLSLILDTGSSDLWISSSECSSCTGTDDLFADAKSSSLSKTSSGFSISYGSGSASGKLASDTVSLGDYTVAKQTFGLVDTASNNLIFSPISGILGFGFKSLAQSGATPWWLAISDSWSSPLFAFHLTRYSTSAKSVNPGGTLTLGHVDSSLYEGAVNWVDVTSETYWVVQLGGADVGGETVAFTGNQGAAIDTGTTLVLGPAADVAAIYGQIDGAREVSTGSWVYPCDSKAIVSLSFGGTLYPFDSADLMRGLYTAGGSECIGAITGLDLGSGAPMGWIIGAAWLKNVYSIFRYSPASVGFAFLPGESPTTTTSSSSARTTTARATSSSSSSSTPASSSLSSSASTTPSSSSASASSSSASGASSSETPIITGGIVTIGIPMATPASASGSASESQLSAGRRQAAVGAGGMTAAAAGVVVIRLALLGGLDL